MTLDDFIKKIHAAGITEVKLRPGPSGELSAHLTKGLITRLVLRRTDETMDDFANHLLEVGRQGET